MEYVDVDAGTYSFGTNNSRGVSYGTPFTSVAPNYLRFSRFKAQAETVLIGDAATLSGTTLRRNYGIAPPIGSFSSLEIKPNTAINAPTIHGRHSGNANIGWLDGHVTTEPLRYGDYSTSTNPADRYKTMHLGHLVKGDDMSNPFVDYYFFPNKNVNKLNALK